MFFFIEEGKSWIRHPGSESGSVGFLPTKNSPRFTWPLYWNHSRITSILNNQIDLSHNDESLEQQTTLNSSNCDIIVSSVNNTNIRSLNQHCVPQVGFVL